MPRHGDGKRGGPCRPRAERAEQRPPVGLHPGRPARRRAAGRRRRLADRGDARVGRVDQRGRRRAAAAAAAVVGAPPRAGVAEPGDVVPRRVLGQDGRPHAHAHRRRLAALEPDPRLGRHCGAGGAGVDRPRRGDERVERGARRAGRYDDRVGHEDAAGAAGRQAHLEVGGGGRRGGRAGPAPSAPLDQVDGAGHVRRARRLRQRDRQARPAVARRDNRDRRLGELAADRRAYGVLAALDRPERKDRVVGARRQVHRRVDEDGGLIRREAGSRAPAPSARPLVPDHSIVPNPGLHHGRHVQLGGGRRAVGRCCGCRRGRGGNRLGACGGDGNGGNCSGGRKRSGAERRPGRGRSGGHAGPAGAAI